MELLALSIFGLAALTSLSAYFLWLQSKTVGNLTRRHDDREKELLDRLMFTTGNRGYVESQRIPLEQPKEEPTDTEWSDL